MGAWSWYRVECRSNPCDGAAVLLRSFPQLMAGGLTIRKPEVHVQDDRLDPSKLYDGALLDEKYVQRVLAFLLADMGFRCDLESSAVRVMSVGDALYLGVQRGGEVMTPRVSLVLEVNRSAEPAMAEEGPGCPYPPASDAFWGNLSQRVADGEPLILLDQWAAGIGGERWYQLSDPRQVPLVRDKMIARSIIAVFSEAASVVGGVGDPPIVNPDVLYGNMRWLVPVGDKLRLSAESVCDELDLSLKWRSAENGALLFQWPDDRDARTIYVACPDRDGLVRTIARFD